MAKRTRKQKQRAAVRRPGPSVAPPTASAPTGVAVEAEDLQPAGATTVSAPASVAVDLGSADAGRRRVERVSGVAAPTRPRPGRAVAAGYIQPLESDDAAIPFDRVPYVPADLRRVGIIAAIMVALIIVADIIVSNVVR